jgi:hypothetical protein
LCWSHSKLLKFLLLQWTEQTASTIFNGKG